jgi:hypothetical protein
MATPLFDIVKNARVVGKKMSPVYTGGVDPSRRFLLDRERWCAVTARAAANSGR